MFGLGSKKADVIGQETTPNNRVSRNKGLNINVGVPGALQRFESEKQELAHPEINPDQYLDPNA